MSQYKFEDKELNEECPGKKKEVEDRLVQIDEMIEDGEHLLLLFGFTDDIFSVERSDAGYLSF